MKNIRHDRFLNVSSKPVLEVENLSKLYRFNRTGKPEEIWALKNLSFSVARGESIGIIGHNGAGKTTLLKIISRITAPTEGRVVLRGRVAALLEMGTGFHPELTGKENIYLNGAIHGMRRFEIDHKYDEIVSFSDIGKFIDLPVKQYSNGMQLRLAFSVAVHLDPEIILLDEILAVGDLGFQMKCFNKMREIVGRGKTVLLVSHNMNLVERFCSRVLWIHQDSLRADGEASEVIESYLWETSKSPSGTGSENIGGEFSATIRLSGENGNQSTAFRMGEGMRIEIKIRGEIEKYKTCIMDILTSTGILAMRMDSRALGYEVLKSDAQADLNYNIREIRLMPGSYFLNFKIRGQKTDKTEKEIEIMAAFEILASDEYFQGHGPKVGRRGVTYMPVTLKVK